MSKTRLRVLRRDIRRELGLVHDPAPSVEQLLESLALLGSMLDIASDGEYGAAVYRFKDAVHLPARSVKTARLQKAAAHDRYARGEITVAELRQQEARIDAWLNSTIPDTRLHER